MPKSRISRRPIRLFGIPRNRLGGPHLGDLARSQPRRLGEPLLQTPKSPTVPQPCGRHPHEQQPRTHAWRTSGASSLRPARQAAAVPDDVQIISRIGLPSEQAYDAIVCCACTATVGPLSIAKLIGIAIGVADQHENSTPALTDWPLPLPQ